MSRADAGTSHQALVVGLGVTGRAIVDALLAKGVSVVVVDDRPADEVRVFCRARGLDLIEAPDAGTVRALVAGCDVVLPAPGLPDAHPALAAASTGGVPVADELDLAQRWDDRPVVAITGTNGKTTVTTLVTEMLLVGGVRAVAAGNVDVPLVAAIADPEVEVFVVEASSFRLGHSCAFHPVVATWLNFAPDHLDVHRDLGAYEAAKARIWSRLAPGDVAVANLADPVVVRNVPPGVVPVTFGAPDAAWRRDGDRLVGPEGDLMAVADLPRALPHDIDNALAAAATARAYDVDVDAVRSVLRTPRPLPHRVALVAEVDGVAYYDDSKATVPQATAAAVSGFESVVLIAGGRNKGLDLGPLGDLADHIRAVVAIGDAAGEIEAAFAGRRPVRRAASMAEAVGLARALARPGDAVVLSPACASFDWYRDYAERGDHFARLVLDLDATGTGG